VSDIYEVVIESNDPSVNARLIVKADTTQALHDRLTAVADGGAFAIIGAATRCLREDVEAQKNLGAALDARPDSPPADNPEPAPTPPPAQKPQEPHENPWGTPQDDGPNLPQAGQQAPAQAPQAAPPQQGGNFPPAPKWARK